MSVRRPPEGRTCFVDFKFVAKRATTAEEVNNFIIAATKSNRLAGILALTKRSSSRLT